jgi:drug/metabolite transporter (DMT)-like permease
MRDYLCFLCTNDFHIDVIIILFALMKNGSSYRSRELVMNSQSRWLRLSDMLLLAVAAVWGSTYAVVKDALVFYPVLGVLALRFGLAFVLLSPILRSMRGMRGRALWGALGCGVMLFCIFLAETFGVMLTEASTAAFLISLCIVFTPWVEWAWLGRRPTRKEWLAAVLSLLGAWLLSGAGLSLHRGDALILLAAVLRALHGCLIKQVMRQADLKPEMLTVVQSGVVAAGSALMALALGQWSVALPAHGAFWASMGYLAVVCTVFAFFVQGYAMRRSTPTRVSLLMGSEPAFGALIACLWLGERLTLMAWLGGALMLGVSIWAVSSARGLHGVLRGGQARGNAARAGVAAVPVVDGHVVDAHHAAGAGRMDEAVRAQVDAHV